MALRLEALRRCRANAIVRYSSEPSVIVGSSRGLNTGRASRYPSLSVPLVRGGSHRLAGPPFALPSWGRTSGIRVADGEHRYPRLIEGLSAWRGGAWK